jgi:hypothetical protein
MSAQWERNYAGRSGDRLRNERRRTKSGRSATPFPDYVSGHSTYSAAAARILTLWTGSEHLGESVTLPTGSSKIEPGVTPAQLVTLKWETFTDAANEAGMSRRYGGIHFASADLAGRKLGRLVADKVWLKAQGYFVGTAKSVSLEQTSMDDVSHIHSK